MDNIFNNDPQECCEEWFDMAIPSTKEFQQSIENNQLDIIPNFPPQILPFPSLDPQEICNHQHIPISTVASTPASITDTSISCTSFASTNRGLHGIAGVKNQGFCDNMLSGGSVHSIHGSSSYPCFDPSGSIHTKCHQEGLFYRLPADPDKFSRSLNLLANQGTPASAAAAWSDKLEVGGRPTQQKTSAALFDVPSGGYKCSVCNMRFSSGNALGGHMSSHAKRRKLEALRTGVLLKSDNSSLHGDGHGHIKP